MIEAIKREVRNAIRIVTNPDQFTTSQVCLAWRIVKQHGVPKR